VVVAVVGVSHHDAPLQVLEGLTHAARGLAPDLVSRRDIGISGVVSLATCNRVEFYLDAQRFHDPIDALTAELARRSGVADLADVLRVRVDSGAARHLFSVAAGLESMVVGEDEIAGQVRRALASARSAGTTTAPLERLFQSASSTAKLVSSSTGLGAAGRSVVGVALDIIEEDLAPLDGADVLVLGTGAYARVVTAALTARGVTRRRIYSSSGRAARFVEGHGGEVVIQDDLVEALAKVDLVVACSGAPHHILDMPLMMRVLGLRSTPLPVVDLALTPDVAPEVRDLDQIHHIDLEVVRDRAPREHGDAVITAHRLINDAVESFEQREASRSADPVVTALRRHVDALVDEEVRRVRRRGDDDVADAIERSLRRFTGQLLHAPTVRARELAREGHGDDYQQALRLLFGFDHPEVETPESPS
jgi:glutamyl-tRNA reductase